MMNRNNLREWVTPAVVGAFALSAVTGVMLFFNVRFGLIKPVHEWLSWLLVISVIVHLIINRDSLIQYISKPVGKGVLFLFLILICLSLLPLNNKKDGPPFVRISNALTQVPLSEVSRIAKHEPDEVIDILKSKGIHVESREQTIRDIAMKNNKSSFSILEFVF
jgi:hypothetical protein